MPARGTRWTLEQEDEEEEGPGTLFIVLSGF
jgi:hypothetical protein